MYWLLKWLLLGPLVRFVARPHVSGAIPKDGPVVIAANHQAEIDSLVLCLALRRRLTYVAKSEYFEAGMRGRLYGRLCRMTGQIPIPRSGGADAALTAASEILSSGGAWAIYPEGTRSRDGHIHRGRTGVMRVALASPQVKVVPVGLIGTEAVDAPGQRGWRRGHVQVRIGKPLDLSPWAHRHDDPRAWREATDALMQELVGLTGLPFHAEYAHRPAPEHRT